MQDKPDTPDKPGSSPLGPEGEMLREGLSPSSSEALMAEAAERIKALEQEAAEFKDKWLRAEAETQNVRNRARREVEDARNYAAQKFALDVVEAAENLERALASLPPEAEGEPEIVGKLREGVAAIGRSFQGALERNGVARQDAAGAKFDPELHQAMAEAPSPEVPVGHVIQAWTPAWTLNGRLIKPAMVVVSKGAPPQASPEQAPAAEPGATLDTKA
ncbi:nucleotide exchange factor GrpE [Elioraea rosea]|uniref:nucleotide exchange factor GrpE n=1 Tax=Elioraea rosea TaxID=2492390 RepID=UPI001181E5D5